MARRRVRVPIQRSSGGCRACKNLHMKCDEGQPSCRKCLNSLSGRSCIYPPTAPPAKPGEYKCSECSAVYTRPDSLKVHEEIHSGVSYTCSDCGAVMTRRDTFNKHMRVNCPKKQIKGPEKSPEIDLQQVVAFQTLLLGLGKSVQDLVDETEKDRLLAEALTENKSLKAEILELRQRQADCQAQLEWEKNCCIGLVKKEEERMKGEERMKEEERMKIEMSSLSKLKKELRYLRGQYTSMLNFNRDLQEALEEEDRKTKSRGKRPRRRGGSS